MIVIIITEVDLETGEYVLTFRNKSNPGELMDFGEIQKAFMKVAKQFGNPNENDDLVEVEPGVLLA